jgi:molybdopterin-biosynthesis enzyme MoeA-like protein
LCGALLPGVPHLLQQKWPAVSAELQAAVQLAPFSNRVVRLLSEDEAAVAPLLDTLAAEWGSEISLGSYPVRLKVELHHHCQQTWLGGCVAEGAPRLYGN